MNAQTKRIARRRWLIDLGRYLALTGIGMFAWNLISRSSGHCYRLTLPCQECGLLAHCRLPSAGSARRQMQHVTFLERNGASHRFREAAFRRTKPAASAVPLTDFKASRLGRM